MSDLDFQALRDTRAKNPSAVAGALKNRQRRDLLGVDGKLMIVAADHPARAALGIGSEAMAMANREDLLQRLATALAHPGVDGVLATPDIIDDLALLGLLENKIVVGSMNRGGLRGASFEMDDRFGAYSIESLVAAGLDFAKTLTRINFQDAGTAETLMATANAVNDAAAAGVPIMIEPFISDRIEGKIENILTPEAVIQSISIVAALGGSSAYTWLKIPYVAEMARVMESTTLPTLILGGDRAGDMESLLKEWASALSLPGVRGLVVGRSLLYPASGNTGDAIARAVEIVHGG
jgi:DhnA family fructose-bisphosphate aldolase class Ia